jgi:hypothetical protein
LEWFRLLDDFLCVFLVFLIVFLIVFFKLWILGIADLADIADLAGVGITLVLENSIGVTPDIIFI